jgi:3-dehydroquinate synthase
MKLSLRSVNVSKTRIIAGDGSWAVFSRELDISGSKRKIFVLTDQNTHEYCLPYLLEQVPSLSGVHVLQTVTGEISKRLENAARLWSELHNRGAGRSSLLICLGGGVVTDLGGFVASGFNRGIEVAHIPTTLIGMVDAAVGGKTAVNLDNVKNQVGNFYHPSFVMIDAGFLKTLPEVHIRSGVVEMTKNIILGEPLTWKKLLKAGPEQLDQDLFSGSALKKWILPAIRVKVNIVSADPQEKKIRKALNFGHTVGHALESVALKQGREEVPHGLAVAAGMACSTQLSFIKAGLSEQHLHDILNFIKRNVPAVSFSDREIPAILELIRSDKKNRNGSVLFSLLKAPGQPKVNVECSISEIIEILNWYQENFSLKQ